VLGTATWWIVSIVMLGVLVLTCYDSDISAFMGGRSGLVISRGLLHP
jgi:hypothetical protein